MEHDFKCFPKGCRDNYRNSKENARGNEPTFNLINLELKHSKFPPLITH